MDILCNPIQINSLNLDHYASTTRTQNPKPISPTQPQLSTESDWFSPRSHDPASTNPMTPHVLEVIPHNPDIPPHSPIYAPHNNSNIYTLLYIYIYLILYKNINDCNDSTGA